MSDFLKRISEFSPKRLLLLAAELEERVRTLEERNHAPIAIVGVGCRFPGGVRDAETYWNLLKEGRDAITDVPLSRWDADALYDSDPHANGRIATRWGGFLDSPDLFDPAFFGIAPVEARAMDPQQRLLLEVSWEALEDAAIVPGSLNGTRTGVFVGVCNSDYPQRRLQHQAEQIDAYFAQGASHAVAAGRISYFLGLRGPSIAIDTACSSSLVAIHQACQSLRLGETDLVLAGGVNLLFMPEVTMALSRAQMMAPDGRCKAFSAAANGFVRSDGCGIVALKRLEDAQRDKDRIIAVIRGTATNQDGRSSGITAPNGPSQEDVIRAALADAGLSANAVSYVEAHGTGTSLGDVIELRALEAAVGKGRAEDARLPVGSVKSNFGHAESAAGVAGLIKLALSLQHREIPASLHCSQPNREIEWQSNHLRVPTASEPWQPAAEQTLRVGAVSSFGFSGTNAHVVVSEHPADQAQENSVIEQPASCVVPLSARSERALQIMAAQLGDRLCEDPALTVDDVALTCSTGRSVFAHRAAIRVESKERLIEELSLLSLGDGDSGFFRGVADAHRPRVAFLFAGQGGERTGMGLSLLAHSKAFRTAVAEVDTALLGVLPASIEAIFRNDRDELTQSAFVQPALYAFQYGLARIWQSMGIEPYMVAGHSMGEIVACTLAGVMSVADASRLVAARGRLTQELGDPGGMVAVAVSEDEALAGLRGYEADVSIAAVNGPTSVVISGRSGPVEQAALRFERTGVRVKRLNISYGSHSPAMHRVLPAFHKEAVKARYLAPRLPILADLTGEMVTDAATFGAQYFTSHLSRPIQFHRCLEQLEKEGCDLYIEMGPRSVLTTFGRERAENSTFWIASANGREDDFLALQSALAEVFAAGATIDWKSALRHVRAKIVSLPTYPFERQRYWMEEADSAPQRLASKAVRGPDTAAAGSAGFRIDASVPIFETEWGVPLPLHLEDHKVGGRVAVAASVYLSLAWDAFRGWSKIPSLARVIDLNIVRPLQPDDESLHLQTVLTPSDQGNEAAAFHIRSCRADRELWTLHAFGRLESGVSPGAEPSAVSFDKDASEHMNGVEFYLRLEACGVRLGAAFRAIRELWFVPGAALGIVAADPRLHSQPEALTGPHPALLDACFQVLGAAGLANGDAQLRLVTHVAEIAMYGAFEEEIFVEAELRPGNAGAYEGSLVLRSRDGRVMAYIHGIHLSPVVPQKSTTQSEEGWLYEQAWLPSPISAESPRPMGRHWVIFGDRAGLAGALVDRMLRIGQSAEAVSSLDELEPTWEGPLQREIVDLRPIEGEASNIIATADSIGEHTIALMTQSLGLWQTLIRSESRLWLFTQGAMGPSSVSRIGGAIHSTLWGLARCATLEHPLRLQRIVDLDENATPEQITSTVVRELLTQDDEEQVAYCGESRQAFRLRPSEIPISGLPVAPEIFHKNGSYLLTGGAGGLGMQVAAYLVQHCAGTLVLVTRSGDLIAARQPEIDALRRAGANVIAIQADVANAEAMEALFARFGPGGDLPSLRGVFHMAADVVGTPIEAIDSAQIRSVFRAKVQGTLVLQELARTLPLDFFVTFSSTAAVLGTGGLGSYAAANCFVERISALCAAEGLPFISVSWGTWQTMRLAGRETQEQYSSSGMLPMPDGAALNWLESLLHRRDLKQPIVANIDWTRFAPLFEAKRRRSWLELVRPQIARPVPALTPSWTAEPGVSRLTSLERTVQKEAARVLGFRRGEAPDVNARLAELGLDSLMAVSLRNRLQTLTGCSLPATFAFEHATPSQMAVALDVLLWGSGVADEEHGPTEREEIGI